MAQAIDVLAEFPPKLEPLFDQQYDHYVIWGGRDGCKSWGVAQYLILAGTQREERILCARETQQSISESVHQLLEDTVNRLQLDRAYKVQQTSIKGPYGTEFVFAGLKHNVNQIKSFERINKIWVEEAQSVSKHSWDTVLPTIRTAGAKVYITFNPRLASDDTYQRWILNPPPKTCVIKIGWEDNLWLSEISRTRIEHMRATDPQGFAHIYGGECQTDVEGAIFGNEMKAALAENRITQVPYNKARPVDTAWDLGFGDLTAIWMVQAYEGFYNFIDYIEGDGLTIADYVAKLQAKGYVYGTDWLPHDSVDTIIHQRLGGSGNREMSIEMLLRQAGRKVRIAPKGFITDRINAARTVFPNCRFDAANCAKGLDALRFYQWGPTNEHGGRKRDPLHSWASHASDGFTIAALAVKAPKIEHEERQAIPVRPPRIPGPFVPFG